MTVISPLNAFTAFFRVKTPLLVVGVPRLDFFPVLLRGRRLCEVGVPSDRFRCGADLGRFVEADRREDEDEFLSRNEEV